MWHKGKKSSVLKQVDRTAKAAALNPTERDHDYHSGKVGRSMTKGGGSATLYPARGQTATVRVFLTTIVKHDEKVKFDVLDETTGEYVAKHVAYAAPQLAGQLHRGHTYRVRFNAVLKNPIIEEIEAEL